MTTLDELAEVVCKDWTGGSLQELSTRGNMLSMWNTGVCKVVCPRYGLDDDGRFRGLNVEFFTGVHLGADKGELAGVLVRLCDSYGNVVIRITSVGMQDDKLSYSSQYNEGVQLPDLLRHLRALVEVVSAELTKELSRYPRATTPVVRFPFEENPDNHIRPDLKVGELAWLAFSTYLQSQDCDPAEIARLQNGAYCHKTFIINSTMPVLVPMSVIDNAPDGSRVGEADFYRIHYWNKVVEVDGIKYRVVNDWKEPTTAQPRDNRTPLEDWIRRMGIVL